jgi:hypothetical protein
MHESELSTNTLSPCCRCTTITSKQNHNVHRHGCQQWTLYYCYYYVCCILIATGTSETRTAAAFHHCAVNPHSLILLLLRQRRRRPVQRTASSGIVLTAAERKKTTDTEAFDWDAISDAEALLACQSYLQRHNRLGQWQSPKRRHHQRDTQASLINVTALGVHGFFWSDPDELTYLPTSNSQSSARQYSGKRRSKQVLNEIMDEDVNEPDEYDDDDDVETMESIERSNDALPVHTFLEMIPRNEPDDVLAQSTIEDFSVFDLTAPASYTRRSEAAQRTWSDPEWQKFWYERRWGSKLPRNDPYKAKRHSLEKRIRAIHAEEFLTHPALLEMSEMEIADAIRTYTIANRKRGATHKANHNSTTTHPLLLVTPKKDDVGVGPLVEETRLTNNTLFDHYQSQAKERQRARSERAKQAYKTRLTNNKDIESNGKRKKKPTTKTATSTSKHIYQFDRNTPEGALERIVHSLENGQVPSKRLVELVCRPQRLAHRKQVLRRILSECFDLRGKCVPDSQQSALLFVTNCSIEQLKQFIVANIDSHNSSNPTAKTNNNAGI